jgi:hypothetical protein
MEETLSFLGLVNIAVRQVTEKYPEDVSRWRFVFRADSKGTVFISTTTWGEFGPLQFVDQSWAEDVVIPWPFEMDIVEADRLLKNAGYGDPYVGVTVRWPLAFPLPKEPYYIFNFGNRTYVSVGIYDGHVGPPAEL